MASSLYRALFGRWVFRRSIIDHRSGGVTSSVAGGASFELGSSPNTLTYTENGRLHTASGPPAGIPVYQKYAYRFPPDRPSCAEVFFGDGRPFHHVDLRADGVACSVRHDCAPDTYHGRFALADDGLTLSVEWDVTGPAKAYTSTTTLEKLSTLVPSTPTPSAPVVAAVFSTTDPGVDPGAAAPPVPAPRDVALALTALGDAGALGAAIWADEALLLGAPSSSRPCADCVCQAAYGAPQPFAGKAGHAAGTAEAAAWWAAVWEGRSKATTEGPAVRCGSPRDALSCTPPFIHDHAARRRGGAAAGQPGSSSEAPGPRDGVYRPAYAATATCGAAERSALCYERLGWGRYAEDRALYDAFEKFGGTAPRTVHLGVDIEAAAGTPVHAPLRGVVHSFADNAVPGDYGPTVVLEHSVEVPREGEEGDGSGRLVSFYSLWGHLSRASLVELRPGALLATGAVIGHVGSSAENGGWPPHVHVQLILEPGLGGREGDFPGVCARGEWWARWATLCPDPAWLLQTPHVAPRPPRPELAGDT